MPAGPMTRHDAQALLAAGGVEQLLEQSELFLAADERRLERLRPVAPATLADDAHRPPRGHGRLLALEHLLAGGLEGDRRARRRDASIHRRARCPAARRSAAVLAVLTMSPATMPWFVAPIVTAASPVRTPARAWMPAPVRHRLDELERRADGPLGIVLVDDRRAPDGHDRIADELLDRAAVALDDLARQVEVARQRVADILRVALLGKRREADEVREQDADELSLRAAAAGRPACLARHSRPPLAAAGASSGVAQFEQNFAPGLAGVPQFGQRDASGRRAFLAELRASAVVRAAIRTDQAWNPSARTSHRGSQAFQRFRVRPNRARRDGAAV